MKRPIMKVQVIAGMFAGAIATALAASSPEPKFRAVEIDPAIQIGYGVVVADVDGDAKPDIVLADKSQIVWYRNPSWQKHVLAENLTRQDNVCVAAQDIDGDGKAEIAVGAGWNPGDTLKSGAVFYLLPGADRTKKWEPVALPHVPTIHRMRWAKAPDGIFELVSVPLHGYGNRNGQGQGVPIMTYRRPHDPRQPWNTNTLAKEWHKTHNFDVSNDDLWIASQEGVFNIIRSSRGQRIQHIATNDIGGMGEVRVGRIGNNISFVAAIEPMHGTNLALFEPPHVNDADPLWKRRVLDSSLVDGHALACADLLGIGRDQIVVGWRAMGSRNARVGIKLLTPLDRELKAWRTSLIDDNTMACEDLAVADLNGDGKLDIVAAGRATKNVKVYFNEL